MECGGDSAFPSATLRPPPQPPSLGNVSDSSSVPQGAAARAATLQRVLARLEAEGGLFAGRFALQGGQRVGSYSVVQFAVGHLDNCDYALKCALPALVPLKVLAA